MPGMKILFPSQVVLSAGSFISGCFRISGVCRLYFPFPCKIEIDGYGRIVLYFETFSAVVADFERIEIAHFTLAAMDAFSVVKHAAFFFVSRIRGIAVFIVFNGLHSPVRLRFRLFPYYTPNF